MKNGITQVCALAVMGAFAAAASPLGTAFTYQGRLTDDGTPANGSYDFWFKLYDADSGGVQVGPTTVLNAQPVSNGLFTVALDFGGNAFTGGDRWLDIYVHNSTNDPWDGWAWLSPRQPLTAAPYALYASQAASAANAASAVTVANSGVTAQGLSTPLAAIPGQLLTYSGGSLVWTNPAPPAVSGWQLGGNSGTSPGVNYIGTSDDRSLEFRVGGSRALRIEWTGGCPHLIGGHPDNYQDGIDEGATIGGGGPNGVVGNFGTVAGGKQNEAGDHGAVAGGLGNAAGSYAAVGGGAGNWARGVKAAVSGGDGNQATGECAVVGGGAGNLAGAPKTTVGGGQWNQASLDWATVGGGVNNMASGGAATVPGGNGNLAAGGNSLAAGTFARALHSGSFVWGDATYRAVESTGPNQFIIQAAGGVGINTNSPASALHVNGTVSATAFSGSGAGLTDLPSGNFATNVARLDAASQTFLGNNIFAGAVGLGVPPSWPLDVQAAQAVGRFVSTNALNGSVIELRNSTEECGILGAINFNNRAGSTPGQIAYRSGNELVFRVAGSERLRIDSSGNVGINTSDPQAALHVKGNVIVSSPASGATLVQLGEGLDYAEGFDVSNHAKPEPGTVLVIDTESPGKLAVSQKAYDRAVAGIAAGANGLGSAVRVAAGRFDCDVALAGRVYCNVDTRYGAVAQGDLLTTSPTPGYAMMVKDHEKAQGAILGKAMERMAADRKGQILVLVTLQ